MTWGIFTPLCICHHNQFQDIFITPKRNPGLLNHQPPVHFSLPAGGLYTYSRVFPVSVGVSVVGISHKWLHMICFQYDCHLSLSIMVSKGIHVIICVSASFLFIDKQYCIYKQTTFCPFFSGRNSILVFAIMNNTVMSICVHFHFSWV